MVTSLMKGLIYWMSKKRLIWCGCIPHTFSREYLDDCHNYVEHSNIDQECVLPLLCRNRASAAHKHVQRFDSNLIACYWTPRGKPALSKCDTYYALRNYGHAADAANIMSQYGELLFVLNFKLYM